MTTVIPAIIPEDYQLLQSEMGTVKGLVPRVQIDIIDGIYAPEASWPYSGGVGASEFDLIVDQKQGFPFWEELQFEIDLMVKNPETVLSDWIAAGASAIIVHVGSVDSKDKLEQCVEKLEKKGVQIGLALKPSEDNSLIDPWIERISFVQVMGNDEIGYHGVELDQSVYAKISRLRNQYPNLPIGVDIGVNLQTAPLLIEAGTTRLVAGSAIFEADNIKQAIEDLQESGNQQGDTT